MKFHRVLAGCALAVLAVSFGAGGFRLFQRHRQENDPERVTIRFAHWQLEAGVGEAFDRLARDYEKLHPKVRIEQLRIPDRVFSQWALTQLIGGTAPDLIELGFSIDTLLKARHFEPLSRFVEAPNPYNAGTELAGLPWRNTFVDGLDSGFDEKLGDTYGIPSFFATIRVYYNRALLQEITGSDQPPASFDEFVALCERTRTFAARSGRKLVPIAASRDNAPYLLDELFASQSQKLVHAFTPLQRLQASPDSFFSAYLGGGWTFDHPAIRSGLTLMREVGQFLQPGFLQLRREDAIFHFSQGHALMVAAGSWEATGLRTQSRFPIGVFRLPVPGPDHPRYGRHTWGRAAESGGRSVESAGRRITGPFGLYQGSKHPEVALDFLRYLSSQRAHQVFVDISGWLPVVVGVTPPANMAGFIPDPVGAPGSFGLRWGTGEILRLTENSWHVLFAPPGGVEAFVAQVAPRYAEAMRADLRRRDRRSFQQLMLGDSSLEASRQLALRRPGDSIEQFKFESLFQAQNEREVYYYYMNHRLAEMDRPRR
jgi:raffinose/stachyose/melibiose transport system substrate-binding protein